MPNEADTCRKFVVPKLQSVGWDTDPHRLNEQVTFNDGRIIAAGSKGHRRPGKRADYLLRYRPDLSIAVVEAKASYCSAADGLQQAKDYAEILGLKFAYATNGTDILEYDAFTGLEREIDRIVAARDSTDFPGVLPVPPETGELGRALLQREGDGATALDMDGVIIGGDTRLQRAGERGEAGCK